MEPGLTLDLGPDLRLGELGPALSAGSPSSFTVSLGSFCSLPLFPLDFCFDAGRLPASSPYVAFNDKAQGVYKETVLTSPVIRDGGFPEDGGLAFTSMPSVDFRFLLDGPGLAGLDLVFPLESVFPFAAFSVFTCSCRYMND